MTWFKVDDKFWSHPKVMLTSMAATGLWIRAGAWSAMFLTDGVVPKKLLPLIGPGMPEEINAWTEELVKVGLWEEMDGSIVFHDWTDHQPTKETVERLREEGKQRQAAFRRRRLTAVTAESRVTNSDPTRPDPARPEVSAGHSAQALTSADADAPPCEHGAPSSAKCALCRAKGRNGQ